MVQGERLVSLVLLPAFLLATLPQAACVCSAADGASACPTKCCGEEDTRCAPLPTGAGCCRMLATRAERSFCRPKQPLERQALDPSESCGECCHQVLVPPSPAASARDFGANQGFALDFVIDALPLPVAPAIAQTFFARDWSSEIPPLDLVIVLRRLTI